MRGVPQRGHFSEKANMNFFKQIERQGDQLFGDRLLAKFNQQSEYHPRRILLEDISTAIVAPSTLVISTVEISRPLFQNLSTSELELVKILTDIASTIILIIGGNLFKAEKPEFNIVNGISRTVILEQPTIKFSVVDIDDPTARLESTTDHILWVMEQAIQNPRPQFDLFVQSGDLVLEQISARTAAESKIPRSAEFSDRKTSIA